MQNTYLVVTAPVGLNHAPHVVVDRVIVSAEDEEKARQNALRVLAQRNSIYLITCLVDGSNAAAGLTIYEWQMTIPETEATSLLDVLQDTHGNALDLKLAATSHRLQRKITALNARCFWLSVLAALLFLVSVIFVREAIDRPDDSPRKETSTHGR